MTIDWLYIGFLLGFVTGAWLCPTVAKIWNKIKKWMKER